MKATGIVRRMDELGRIVVPKEIRKNLRIREGDPFEIFVDEVNGQPMVCFCKYNTSFINSLASLADTIDEEMMESAGVTNRQRYEVREHFNKIAKILKEWEENS